MTNNTDGQDKKIEGKGKTPRPQVKDCAQCGTQYNVPKSGPVGAFCNPRCRAKHYLNSDPARKEKIKEKARKRASEASLKRNAERLEWNLANLPEQPCEHCGKLSGRTRTGAPKAHCSRACGKATTYRKYRGSQKPCTKGGCDSPSIAKGLCGSHYSMEWRKGNPDKAQAIRHRYRSNKHNAWVEDVSRDEILNRDEWTCHLCGEQIPKTLTWPHKLYPTLDHVTPLSIGGKHESGNVKAAHFICNSAKSHSVEWEADEYLMLQVSQLSSA